MLSKNEDELLPPEIRLKTPKSLLEMASLVQKLLAKREKIKIKYQLHASAHCVSCTSRLSNRPSWTNHATNHARWTLEETELTSLLSALAP